MLSHSIQLTTSPPPLSPPPPTFHMLSLSIYLFLCPYSHTINVSIFSPSLSSSFSHIQSRLHRMSRLDEYTTPSTTTTTLDPFVLPSTMDPSIDRVVFQIEQLGGAINDLGASVNEAVADVGNRAQQTVNTVLTELTGNKTGVPDMLNTVSDKFSDWPVQLFLAVCICGLILIIIALIFLISKGVAAATEYRYKQYIKSSPADIENL